jgi:4-amino-4-deoxychorismate lyase
VLCASSVRKITRVHTLDGEPLADSSAIHRELADAYDALYA